MVKKLQKMAEKKAASPAGLLDGQLAQTIKDSAQQIWLAGLGAFAKAQNEGTKVFDALIKEGTSLHRKTQTAAEGKLGDVAGKMSAMAGEVGAKANNHWDKLESIFEERTARALGRLGVPTAKELAALAEQVAALQAQVARLGGAGSAAGTGAKPADTARPARKPAAVRRKPYRAAPADAAPAPAPAPVEAAQAPRAPARKRSARSKPAAGSAD